jgi:hypothetical protein
MEEKEKLVMVTDGSLTPGQSDRLTVGCKITLTLVKAVLLHVEVD